MTGTLVALGLSVLALRALWGASGEALQRVAGQCLVLWIPVFALGFMGYGVLFALALFLSVTPLLLWVRSLWSGDDGGEPPRDCYDGGPPEPWGYIPRNPFDAKRKESKDPLWG